VTDGRRRHTARTVIVVLGVLAVLVAHVAILHGLSAWVALPATGVAAVIVLAVVKHLALLAPGWAWLHRRRAKTDQRANLK